jgi:RHS repeat-associated protein
VYAGPTTTTTAPDGSRTSSTSDVLGRMNSQKQCPTGSSRTLEVSPNSSVPPRVNPHLNPSVLGTASPSPSPWVSPRATPSPSPSSVPSPSPSPSAPPAAPTEATSTLSLMFGDGQGSATVMMQVTLDASGAMLPASVTDPITRNAYTPYGAVRGLGTSAQNDQLSISKGWLNQVSDEASTGLVYLNARYYDPAASRFVSPDPLMNPADPKTLDAFRYADNNPVMFTDATGLFSCPAWMPTGVCEAADNAAVASNKAAAASKAAANAASAAAAIAGAASARTSTSSKPAEPSVSQAIADVTDKGPCGSPGWYYPCAMRPTDTNDQIAFQQKVDAISVNGGLPYWAITRFLLNVITPVNLAASIAAGEVAWVSGASCHFVGSEMMTVCEGGGFSGFNGGTNFGNVYVTDDPPYEGYWDDPEGKAELHHEGGHAGQWAVGLGFFPAAYGYVSAYSAVVEHKPAWCNMFEAGAGYHDGHYDLDQKGMAQCVG